VLLAFWPTTFTHILYPKPWLKLADQNNANSMSSVGTAILPPANIMRSFLIRKVDRDEDQEIDEKDLPKRKTFRRTISRKISRKISNVFLLADHDSDDSDGEEHTIDVESGTRMSLNPLAMTNVMKVIVYRVSVHLFYMYNCFNVSITFFFLIANKYTPLS
jgi:hypothetical protein